MLRAWTVGWGMGWDWRHALAFPQKNCRPPHGTCWVSIGQLLGTSPNSHRVDAWQAALRASLFLLFFLKLELVREGKYSQLQFQILLSSEPKPNIPPGTGGQNQDDLQ